MKMFMLTLGLLGFAVAEDVRLTVHMVAMEPAKLTALMAEPNGPSIGKARAMVKAGEARLFNTMLLRMKSGVTAKLVAGGAVTYPSEYESSDWPDPEGGEVRRKRKIDGWIKAFPFMPIQGAWPGRFETRDVGESLEWSVNIELESQWFLNLTRYVGDTVYLERPVLDGGRYRFRHPEFETLALDRDMKPGGWLCAGVLAIPGKDGAPGEKIVVFARAETLKVAE
jgi:hypothetical protein